MGANCCKQDLIDFCSEVDLSHFELLRAVGKGAFGKVRVVRHRKTKQLYALKYINKVKCISMRATNNIISERRLLEKIDHGLMVNMRYAFQDDENLFMVLDLMLGGDLRYHLDLTGAMRETNVQFYAAQLALGLNYLHNHHIMHRDLKPDNILLDENGHAHITDFNIAVQFSESKLHTSMAGSMAYMAPEVLQSRGYDHSVDWWSLGVVCYELLFGKRPFRGKSTEALQRSILLGTLTFPSHNLSDEAIDFIKGLLNRDISQRLGYNSSGFQRLQAHPWLRHMPWELLENKQTQAPFIPDKDKINFDPTHELEEMLLEENPLKVRKRAPKLNGNNTRLSYRSQGSEPHLLNTNPDWQRMEDKFLPFDHTKPKPRLYSDTYSTLPHSPSIDKPTPTHTSSSQQSLMEKSRAYYMARDLPMQEIRKTRKSHPSSEATPLSLQDPSERPLMISSASFTADDSKADEWTLYDPPSSSRQIASSSKKSNENIVSLNCPPPVKYKEEIRVVHGPALPPPTCLPPPIPTEFS
ncbi:kinase-like domain-containing protein [Spinellus fusiger]|nr:kinase-like domain-containing protein [Spinellus fusiger]